MLLGCGLIKKDDKTDPTQKPTEFAEEVRKGSELKNSDFYGKWYGDYGEVLEIKGERNAVYKDHTGTHNCCGRISV